MLTTINSFYDIQISIDFGHQICIDFRRFPADAIPHASFGECEKIARKNSPGNNFTREIFGSGVEVRRIPNVSSALKKSTRIEVKSAHFFFPVWCFGNHEKKMRGFICKISHLFSTKFCWILYRILYKQPLKKPRGFNLNPRPFFLPTIRGRPQKNTLAPTGHRNNQTLIQCFRNKLCINCNNLPTRS